MAHVLLEWALLTKDEVSGRGLLLEEAVETLGGAATGDRGMVASAVGGVVFGLGMAALTADSTLFVCFGAGACVYVMGKEEAPLALMVLHIEYGQFYHACLSVHIAQCAEDTVSSVMQARE